jgi:chemotaxis regulatin CheY-phosphate phosphatase CheZ
MTEAYPKLENEAYAPETSIDVDAFLALVEMAGPDEMRHLLSRAYEIISHMLASVREGRDMIQRTTVQKLHVTEAKLHEISDATETAAFDMLDGLDRSIKLVDRFEAEELGRRSPLGTELREELYGVIGHLQFQDITAQQLNHASSVLQEMEQHLTDFVRLFGVGAAVAVASRGPSYGSGASFDPAATTSDAAERQRLVDSLIDDARR